MSYARHEFPSGTICDHGRSDAAAFTAEDEAALEGALIDGTMLSTDQGWRPVETLKVGDRVLTASGQFCPLELVERRSLWSSQGFPRRVWPLRIPPDVLDNVTPLFLLPRQRVRMERPTGLVEASQLEGTGGVTACSPGRELSVTRIGLEQAGMLLANYGAVLHCPASPAPAEGGAQAAGAGGAIAP